MDSNPWMRFKNYSSPSQIFGNLYVGFGNPGWKDSSARTVTFVITESMLSAKHLWKFC
jgi:hypothetical protein